MHHALAQARKDGCTTTTLQATDVGLRVTASGNGEHVTVRGNEVEDDAWLSPNYRSATHHADLEISTNFGAVDIDPIGGCA